VLFVADSKLATRMQINWCAVYLEIAMPLTPMETILVVDDDTMVRTYVTAVLANYGYQVYAAGSGRHGFVCFMEHADDIDLVFTDIVMPEMSGPEMVKRIQTYRPKVKVLFMTGYHPLQLVSDHPGCAVLQKPFTKDLMLSSIQHCLRT
jgi:two-component system, cell cycle sensor histidine kinase and response regulator CckA